jgi:hypothetical protein
MLRLATPPGGAAGAAGGVEAERPAGPPPAEGEAGPSSAPAPVAARQRPVSLVWLRRDLRLDDNPALTAALKTGGNVVRGAGAGARRRFARPRGSAAQEHAQGFFARFARRLC